MSEKDVNITAKIKNITYIPTMTNKNNLKEFSFKQFSDGETCKSQFLLKVKNELIAVSCWVSPKRTRSYPYVRVYETLTFKNRVTIIPLVKDEGFGGDRDFLQWDTVSLMSLLGVYVIIAYYNTAEPSSKSKYSKSKITNQNFDYKFLSRKIEEYLSYQSDALHWNLKQLEDLSEVANLCEQKYYQEISPTLGIPMHDRECFRNKIEEIISSSENFKRFSRTLAEEAQNREVQTIQPKELLTTNPKTKLTIKNYLGGAYYFTTDECLIHKDNVFLIEKKHTKDILPSLNDIKDGIIKMILFSNLVEVKIDNKIYFSYPVLSLTAADFPGIWTSWGIKEINCNLLSQQQLNTLNQLENEAKINHFYICILNENLIDKQNNLLVSIIKNIKIDYSPPKRSQTNLDQFFQNP